MSRVSKLIFGYGVCNTRKLEKNSVDPINREDHVLYPQLGFQATGSPGTSVHATIISMYTYSPNKII